MMFSRCLGGGGGGGGEWVILNFRERAVARKKEQRTERPKGEGTSVGFSKSVRSQFMTVD